MLEVWGGVGNPDPAKVSEPLAMTPLIGASLGHSWVSWAKVWDQNKQA